MPWQLEIDALQLMPQQLMPRQLVIGNTQPPSQIGDVDIYLVANAQVVGCLGSGRRQNQTLTDVENVAGNCSRQLQSAIAGKILRLPVRPFYTPTQIFKSRQIVGPRLRIHSTIAKRFGANERILRRRH